ncbi:hypothetical protein [Caulobacter henricii]|uniref:Glycerophosphoryl diester phosphodiesterase membrane domain-containing protein n=1 Tax=Caulobacter henricii TaxID=69395 RepID=A0A0N7JH84_9CAUL|nr:hypothetical protein [Caulobacter henricii]ALL12682.1 hypothetical protein AQ619_04555 [Caulobacter henricii]
MTALSPINAALEGVRTMRRHPVVVLAWAGFSLVMLPLLGLLAKIVLSEQDRMNLALRPSSADPREILDFVSRLGGVMVLLILLALVLGAILSAAIMRSVLHPEDRRFAYLRLGREELRLLGVSVITWAAALMVTIIPGGVLALGTALLAETPIGGWFTFLGGLTVIGLSTWVAVRLSLLAPHAFLSGHIDPRAAWLVTHGQFWRLLATIAVVIVLCVLMSILGATVSSLVGALIAGGLEDPIAGGAAASHPRLILALLANLLLAPVFLTLQAVLVTSAPAAALRQLMAAKA